MVSKNNVTYYFIALGIIIIFIGSAILTKNYMEPALIQQGYVPSNSRYSNQSLIFAIGIGIFLIILGSAIKIRKK
jgi:hypothetical protein